MQKVKTSMTTEDLAELTRATHELRLKQETPDPPEALKTVPSLSLQDIPKEPIHIPTEVIIAFPLGEILTCLPITYKNSQGLACMLNVGWGYQWSKSFAA